MTASATLDIATYIQPTTDTSGGGSKTYTADTSSGFASALDNANKNYSPNQTNEKTTTPQTQKVDKNDNDVKNTSSDNTKTQMQTENTEDKVEQTDNNTKTDKTTQAETQTTASEPENKADSSNQATQQASQATENIPPQAVQQATEQTTQQPEQKTETNDKTQPEMKTADTNNVDLPIETIIQGLATVVQTQVASNTVDTTPQANSQNNPTQAVQATAPQVAQTQQTPQLELNVDLTNATDKMTNATKPQVQPQTQQALSNIKINPQDLAQTQTQPQQIQSQSAETTTTQASTPQTPVIQVNTEVIAADVNVVKPTTDVNNTQNLQNKTVVTQELLDKTNAKVTSVETNTSNSNNLLNKQNAQEQVVKLSIESNDKPKAKIQDVIQDNTVTQNTQPSPTVAAEPNVATETVAVQDKMIQSTTTQTTVQAPQAKELNKTDILSQINNQLNAKQLQTNENAKVSIILQPENLGKITLELVNSKEGLTAKMTTDNEQVKELLSKHLDNLKDTMSNQGVNVGNITVKVDETQKQSNEQSSFDNWQSKQGNQEFSGNSQNKNQNEFNLDEQNDIKSFQEADSITDIDPETITETTNANIENTVSVSTGSNSLRVDYKV